MSQQAYPYDQYYGQTYPYPHGYSQSYSHRPPGSAGYGYDYPQSSQPPPPGSEERREGRRYYSNQSGSSSGYYEGGYPQAGGYTGYPTYHQSADGAYGNIHHGSPVAASYGSSAAYAAWRASHEVERRKSIISASRRSSATSITEVARRPSISEHPIGTPSPVTPVTSLERSPIIESPSREEQEASPTRSTASGLRTSSPEKKVTIGAASPISPAASDSPTAQASATANVPQAAENIKTVAEKPDHDISGAEACAGSIVLAASTFAEEHNNRVQKDAQLPVSSVASNANISQKAAEVPTSGRCEPKNTSMVRETSPRKEPLPAQSKSSTGLSSDESLSDLSDIPDSSSSDSEGLSEEQSGSSTSESEDNADGDSDAPEDYAPETVNILDDFSKPLLDPNDMDSDDFEYTDSAVTKSSSDELMKTPDRPRRRSYRGGAPRGRRRSDEDDGTNTRSRRIIESDSESDRDTSRSTSTGRPRSARSKKQVGRPRRERDDDDHAPDVAASAPGDEEKGVEEPVVPKKRGRPSLASKRALEELRKSQVELYEQANGSRARRNSIASVSVAGSESSATPTSRRPSTVSKARPEPGFYIEKRFVRMEKLNEPDRSGRTLLFKYAGRGDYSACQTLVGHGANVHPKDNAGWTALHEACLEGHCDIASLLIEHGADVNVPGDNDDTPLHDAVQRGHEQVVECLLLHGASIYAKNADGETPFSVADDDMKRVIKDWIANAADVLSFDDSGRTPLHHACHAGDEKAVLHNIRYGADVNQKDKAGWTPLHEAALQGRSSVCRILLDHGASVDAKGLRGDTPLLDAVTNGHAECVVILLRYGADATQKNDEGKSPMSVAEKNDQ
ncbi:hypothetical protein BC832DRAFT_317065 [Gaertneriomyces semiglobifer]|nr:hypothetical protein BC832DRAFT_317065 [Gaertneriomyces semiglobifer]